MPRAQKPIEPDDEQDSYTFSDEATKKKIRRHINDIRDVITEKDIANAKVPGKDDENEPISKEEAEKKEEIEKEIKPSGPVTPWDMLDAEE
jgi:hypothetical protein